MVKRLVSDLDLCLEGEQLTHRERLLVGPSGGSRLNGVQPLFYGSASFVSGEVVAGAGGDMLAVVPVPGQRVRPVGLVRRYAM